MDTQHVVFYLSNQLLTLTESLAAYVKMTDPVAMRSAYARLAGYAEYVTGYALALEHLGVIEKDDCDRISSAVRGFKSISPPK